MADIKISTQVLMDTAGKVRSINATLTEKLNEINYTMQSLEGSWKIDKLIQTQLIIEEPTAEPAPASPAPQ